MTAPSVLEVLVPTWLVELDLLAWLDLASWVCWAQLLCYVSPTPLPAAWAGRGGWQQWEMPEEVPLHSVSS